MDYQEKRTLYKARTTVLEMLRDRNYDIPADFFALSFEDFLLLVDQNNLDMYLEFPEDRNEGLTNARRNIYVTFLYQSQKAINKKEFDALINRIEKKLDKPITEIELMIVFRIAPGKSTCDMLDRLKIQYFFVSRLVFNPTKHVLVPEHRLLKTDDAKEVLKKYNANRAQLPKMSRNDVIAKYYGLRQGDVVEIKRNSPNAGIHYFYRVII